MNNDDELCDKCGKSLFMIYPYEQFNCTCPDESYLVFVYEDESTKQSVTQLKDVPLGGKFVYGGKVYTKTSKMGWFYSFGNATSDNGVVGHIHPTERVSLLQ